ncbi:hypothetical protein AB0P07_02390 [Streptomyces sp. NPDC085944]|uniref:hypothetical protein n=1 Tax=Streptomyces sp. NPDC085944 TaxID=3154962 RepID=UPI00341BCC4F
MATALFLVLTLAPLVAPFAVVGAAVALARRARVRAPAAGRCRPSGTTCALLAVLGGGAALGAYAWGLSRGFYLLDPDQMCASRGARGDHVVTRAALPVSVRCVTGDGAGTELVPGWVNPVVVAGLALFALAVVEGVLGVVRRRTRRTRASGGSHAW